LQLLLNSVVFSPDIFEVQRLGGVSRYFVELAENIKSLGEFQVEVSTAIHINSYLRDSGVNSGMYLPFSPNRMRMSKLMSSLNEQHSRKLTEKKSFAISHETFYRGGVKYLATRYRVTTVYDLIREKFTTNWNGFAAKQLALTRADAVICISQSTANDLQDYYKVDPSKISVVYLGVSDRFFRQDDYREEKSNRNQLLYVGGREGYKDFRTLVLAFSQSNFLRDNFRVLVFGAKFTKEEVSLMSSLKVIGSFDHAAGRDEALISAYRSSVGLVITSIYEGFGLTALEAMVAGCPVISSGGGSLDEITGGLDFRFEPSNPESLVEAIMGLMYKPHLLKELKDKALRHAQAFKWAKTTEDTVSIYKNLINSG
jgi:glycosyltransferase involved in cell wall biosynthesis